MPSPRFFEMIIQFLNNFSADVVFPSNKLIMKSIARVSVFSTNIYQAKMERKFLRTLFVTESWFCWEMNILHTKSHFISLHRFNDACLKCLTTSEASSERDDLNSNAFLMITVSSLLHSPWLVDEYILVDETVLRLGDVIWAQLEQAGVRADGGEVGAAAPSGQTVLKCQT